MSLLYESAMVPYYKDLLRKVVVVLEVLEPLICHLITVEQIAFVNLDHLL
jgi:hypothetical protein